MKTMANVVARMTKAELRSMIESVVEDKLLEILGDPDEGMAIRRAVRNRLRRQKRAVAAGERGRPLAELVRRLRLE